MSRKHCYMCGEVATTKEHIPPKAFFPEKKNLKLKTVPSCKKHNNDKSEDDQYVLAQICINTAKGVNLPKEIFKKSIFPQLERSKSFLNKISKGSKFLDDGAVAYPVDINIFDSFFEHFAHAIYFDEFGEPLDRKIYKISHSYLSLSSNDENDKIQKEIIDSMYSHFFFNARDMMSFYESDRLDDLIYQNKIIAPVGNKGSITLLHIFYGTFNVVSLLTRKGVFTNV